MRIRDVDLNSEEWRNLVFEGRNKEYGAYYLRRTSARRHLLALFIVIAAVIISISFLKIIHFNRVLQAQDYEYNVKTIELSNLIGWEESIRNTQVKVEEKPSLKEIVKFTPPTIAKDETMEEAREELQETNLVSDSTDVSSGLEEDTILIDSEVTKLNADEDTTAVDEKNRNAEFPDGKTALLRYIYQNIHYPPDAVKQRIQGRVVCSFIVNEDGSLSEVTLVHGVYTLLDEEVQRVIRSMPLWKPAMKDGKAIKIKYMMPVVFRMN